ncbi:cysteine--tRNA ligase [Lacibacterium aquatile]|uniref:Cysteine--tRNA ligase n=1 Tax=Lacibacterium aquatile TaxID=1168082 RepID=A0ABW5DVH2_9PROT
MPLQFHNTLARKKEEFVPLVPGQVSLYVCGPTVYDRAHIGNARPAVVFDVLARFLRTQFDKVTYVRNITDVDDKINRRAKELGVSIRELTAETEKQYLDDIGALGVLPPDIMPRVTDHIGEIIAMAAALIAGGYAYEAEGHVLFHVAAMDDYGKLSGHSRDDLIAGARIDVAPYKKDPADFVLWKPSTPDMPGWDSPWGYGRPGWHIECSAMIQKHLGPTIDIHGGGNDLIFPHHENELAQSKCTHKGEPLARYWLHNGMLQVEGEKMSKSVGNFFTVRDLLERAPGEAIRLVLMTAHYRQPLDWTEEGLQEAVTILDRFYLALRRVEEIEELEVPPPEAFIAALSDDLNTPLALSVLHAMVTELNKADDGFEQSMLKGQILSAGNLLGLLQQEPEAWLRRGQSDSDAERIEGLIADRIQARKDKNFARADEIRKQLTDEGIVLEDGPSGTTWRKA